MSSVTVSVRGRQRSSEVLFVLNSTEVTQQQAERIVAAFSKYRGNKLRDRMIELSTEGGNFAITATLDHPLNGSSFDHYLSLRFCAAVILEELKPHPVRFRADRDSLLLERMVTDINQILDMMS
ncbi:hypothetical protein CYG49_02790 [Candidatus Saccharibacteria bacterium]|nr:MAG: hypothetical protein CYG49_02790 [Candidatus Saccharibacteria bacterium]